MKNEKIYVAVVDDDESVCRSFSRLLRAAHFQPVTYPSAEAFLDDTKHPKFDCLVLDIQLEGISGLELRKRLSAAKDGTPVVFMTAHDDPEVRAQAEASGCAGFFRKTDSGTTSLRQSLVPLAHLRKPGEWKERESDERESHFPINRFGSATLRH